MSKVATGSSGATGTARPPEPLPDVTGSRSELRVYLVADTFFPAFAGGALRFQRYIPRLRAHGIDVEVICGTPTAIKARLVDGEAPGDSVRLGEFLPDEQMEGTVVHRVRLPDTQTWRREYHLSRALARFCQRSGAPDVVQLLSVSPAAMPALARVRRSGARIVFTGTMTATLPSRRAILALKRLRLGTPLRLVDTIVTSTDVMRQHFRALRAEGEVEVIPNGVDLQVFHPPVDGSERLTVRSKLGIEPEASMLLYVGAVTPRKGIELLLEAWIRHVQRHPDSHLVIAGPERTRFDPAHAGYHARLEALREASGAPERVHFLGVVENVPELMRAADVLRLRLASGGDGKRRARSDGVGTARCPDAVHRSGASSWADLMSTTCWRKPDAHSIASCLSHLTADPELRDRIARSARARVEEHMDVERSPSLGTRSSTAALPRLVRQPEPGEHERATFIQRDTMKPLDEAV